MTDRAPPYPADTLAKGWRFELDYEQIERSDTWPLAAEMPMAQHALLMMWLIAWQQKPCGSFPNDEKLIRAKCRIPSELWESCRGVLMRGWWPATDGRLYHDTLAALVSEMMLRRRSDADRTAAKRARDAANKAASHGYVTRDTCVSPSEVPPKFDTDHRPPYRSSPPSGKKARASAQPTPPVLRPEDVDEQTWADWLALRTKKRAPVTHTVLQGAREEAGKAQLSLQQFLAVWCRRGSQGLEAAWLQPGARPSGADPPKSFREREIEITTARVHEMTGGLASAKPVGPVVDAFDEALHAQRRLR